MDHFDLPLAPGAPGNARAIRVFRFGAAGARPRVWIQAGLHAGEVPPMLVAHLLCRLLAGAEITGEILVAPMVNPIGIAQRSDGVALGRFELGSGENFNRHYPDLTARALELLANTPEPTADDVRAALGQALAERTPQGELESFRHHILAQALAADLVLDLHCDDAAVMHFYCGPDHWPGLADLAAQTGAAAVLTAERSGGDPFDEAVAAPWSEIARARGLALPGCPTATLEYRGEADVDAHLAAKDAAALLRFLQGRGAVKGDPGPRPAPKCQATPLNAVEMVTAPAPGIVTYAQEVGDSVKKGDIIAEITDPTSASAPRMVTAGTSGVIFARLDRRFVRPGDVIAKIAGSTPLPGRAGHLLTA